MGYFDNALSNFTFDLAGGDAIRKLAGQDYSVEEIRKQLDYPVSKERIAGTVWAFYLQSGRICLDLPSTLEEQKKVTYVRQEGANGRVSMRQVVEKIDCNKEEYIPVDLGRLKYRKNPSFLKKVETLSDRDKSYVMDLPWPRATVYHVKSEQIERILKNVLTD